MKYSSPKLNAGFSLVEMLVVIALIGILGAIAAPSWISFLNRQRLNSAQAEALSVIRQAQVNAKAEKRIWQASFRNSNGKIQWAVHPENVSVDNVNWNNLLGEDADKIDIEDTNTTLRKENDIYHVQFQYKGRVNGQLGKVTFILPSLRNRENAPRSCVWVSTLLGALRTDRNSGCLGN
ncbi:MAG TPA: type II secretion system protein [Leptolyngbyaceae cyanobacterium]